MSNRWKRAWEALKGNGGSGVILVLVAITCITLMSASLMLLSYTAYKMKVAERQNKTELYEADSKMDELVAKIQNVVSDAIEVAQKEVFETYELSDRNARFREILIEEVSKKLCDSDGTCNTVYLLEALQGLPGALTNNNISIENDGGSTGTIVGSQVILRNIEFVYKSEQSGNFTTIKTDIIIDVSELDFERAWDIEGAVQLKNWSVN